MMSFKEFYLHSSKGAKAPPRAWRSSQDPQDAEQDFGPDQETEGSQVWVSPHV